MKCLPPPKNRFCTIAKMCQKDKRWLERLEEIKTELQSLADALDGIWKRGRENSPVSE